MRTGWLTFGTKKYYIAKNGNRAAGWTQIRGKWYSGMLYIGNRPTLNNGNDISMEVNLFDFSDNIYNDTIRISFLHFIRGDIKFNSLDELKEQLQKDRIAVQQIIEEKASCITKP